jgi:hypothetical protein
VPPRLIDRGRKGTGPNWASRARYNDDCHPRTDARTLVPSAGSVTLVTRQRPEAHWLLVAQAGALLAGSHSGSATVAGEALGGGGG